MQDGIQQLLELKSQRVTLVDMRDKIIRLYKNPDFRTVFLEEYMVMEVARFMEVAGNPNQSPVQRSDSLQAAYAPGHLKRWLDARLMMGDTAAESIEEIDDEILEMENEESRVDKYGIIGEMSDDEEGL